jgi:iron(III) transport system substrate-binding protein
MVALIARAAAAQLPEARASNHATPLTLYTSIDQPIAKKIVDAFEQSSSIRVRIVTDTEASKSVGLAERLRAERDRPRADVWWGNEIFHTIALADEGLLSPMDSPALDAIDPHYIDAQKRFAGVGLRVRVLAVAKGTSIDSIEQLAEPRFKDQIVLARPSAGTTGGHVAALRVLWGPEKFDSFFRALRANNAAMVGGNSVSAQQVAQKNFLVGLTDNDDVSSVNAAESLVEQVIPDQGDHQIGTLAIPTTVALVSKPDRSPESIKLVEFLLSEQAERILLEENFILASTRRNADAKLKVRAMDVDYAKVAAELKPAVSRAIELLEGR